jgi:hypothetical protein
MWKRLINYIGYTCELRAEGDHWIFRADSLINVEEEIPHNQVVGRLQRWKCSCEDDLVHRICKDVFESQWDYNMS